MKVFETKEDIKEAFAVARRVSPDRVKIEPYFKTYDFYGTDLSKSFDLCGEGALLFITAVFVRVGDEFTEGLLELIGYSDDLSLGVQRFGVKKAYSLNLGSSIVSVYSPIDFVPMFANYVELKQLDELVIYGYRLSIV